MSDNLKPCPFCGIDEPDYCDEHGGDWHFIQCRSDECQAEGPRWMSKDAAIAAWNRRPQKSPCDDARMVALERVAEAAKRIAPMNITAEQLRRAPGHLASAGFAELLDSLAALDKEAA